VGMAGTYHYAPAIGQDRVLLTFIVPRLS
jgi:hypothetical protein